MSETAGAAPDRWLAGPVPDLVLGCGLGYLAWVALLWIPGVSTPLLPWIPFGTGLLALVTATPHYGATLLRVYEQRSDRRRYAFFALYATFVIAASFVGAVYWLPLGSLLVTLYVTWSPWHFAGQNYGLASMFLRRRGIGIDAGTRRLLYACFALSFVLAFLALHRGEVDLRVAPVPVDIYGPYEILSLGLPAWLVQPAFWAVSFAYYLAADVMLVTPLRDGMNLVAKEFLASRVDEGGTLVLSEFAGAANELGRAIMVNPFDIDGMASAIEDSLETDPAHARRSMRAMRKIVRENDVYRWADRFVGALWA
jgi:hypothetical protein